MSLVVAQNRCAHLGGDGVVPPGRLGRAAERCLGLLLRDDWDHAMVLDGRATDGAMGVPDLLAVMTLAARQLGERWVADLCDFADVTLGLHRLTMALFAVEDLPDPGREPLHGGAVLLATAPGDQHSFGLATVALALRRAGWDVSLALAAEGDALARAARRVDCVGLSIGFDRAEAPVAALVAQIRLAARARPPVIALGGPMVARDPDIARRIGADLVATDGFTLAEQLRPLRLHRAA